MNYKKLIAYISWITFLIVSAICVFPVARTLHTYVKNTPWESGLEVGVLVFVFLWFGLFVVTVVTLIDDGEFLNKEIIERFRSPRPPIVEQQSDPKPVNWKD